MSNTARTASSTRTSSLRRRYLAWAAGAVLASALLGLAPMAPPAYAFTGENHEEITRKALVGFDMLSLDALADAKRGAIVADDQGAYFDLGPLHCDNADYFQSRPDAAPYPRTREEATDELLACIQASVARFNRALYAADRLVDRAGRVRADQVSLSKACDFKDGDTGPAKCDVIEHLGRGWHPIEDFYSHSNYADEHDPTEPVSVTNPVGLRRTVVAPFFDIRGYSTQVTSVWRAQVAVLIPRDLTTGCYKDFQSDFTMADCGGRILHDGVLAKDEKGSARSVIGDNFNRARTLAERDIARQWESFQAALVERYRENNRGSVMGCAIMSDDPVLDC